MEPLEKLTEEFIRYFDRIISKSPAIATGFVVILILNFVLRFLRKKVSKLIHDKIEDKLIADFSDSFLRITNIIIMFLLFIYMIGFGNIAGSILGAAGISAFVIGFALKDIGENFLAGVLMAFDRPFRLGDTIKTGDVEGTIVKMSLRDTQVKTFDGKDVYVPNGQIIKKPLYNYTIDGFIRHDFIVGVDYNTDIEHARSIIQQTLDKIPGILTEEKKPTTCVSNLNTSTVDIKCFFWTDTFNKSYSGIELKTQAQTKTIQELVKAKVGMPADIIEIKNYEG